MESKLTLFIFLIIMVLIIGTAVYFIFYQSKSGQVCGGTEMVHCPAGLTCLVQEDAPDAVGKCVSSIDPFLEKVFTRFPQLRSK